MKTSTTHWKFELMGLLASPTAPRLFTAARMHQFIQEHVKPGASNVTARSATQSLAKAGALRQISSGVFLNRQCTPPGEPPETASTLRAGAVVSLHSVLGECGFLNNPPAIVTAVVPTSSTKRPRLGELVTSQGDVFRFYGLAERFFPTTDAQRWQMLQPGRPCPMFRPEAALLQWLHLAKMKRSRLTAPPQDVDMAQLDAELLNQLAQQWGLARHLADWLLANNLSVQTDANPTPQSLGQAARERVLANRTGGD